MKKIIFSLFILGGVAFESKAHRLDSCVVPTAVTPNSDGKNDMLVIPCLTNGVNNTSELAIFSRWGDRVFFAKPYKNDFDGTYRGLKLPDGQYFYTFKESATSDRKKGYILLMR
jgi:gliding motility-associated-like protein